MTCEEFIKNFCAQYTVVSCLSDANDARVLRLRHSRLGRDIVLRKYRSFVGAYDILKSHRHPSLPEIYDTYKTDDGQIVLEEYIDGVSVAQVLEGGRYTYGGAARVLKDVASAVSALHSLGIVHRDIKPENVIVSSKGKVYLIDLNASRIMKKERSRDTVVLGTIGYAPPEQYGIGNSDGRADVYALGVLLNVMLTGEHPSTRLAAGKAGKIVTRCTQISPEKRYQSAEEFAKAL